MSALSDASLEPAPIQVPEREAPAQPYRGIAPFRFIDEPIFFGRIAESQRLLRLVTMFRGVLLYGDSGAGKSSLLNARFVPDAIADGFLPERIRVQPKPGAEIVLDRIAVRERGMPPFLPSNLITNVETPRAVISCEQLRDQISRSDVRGYPLLIFDQFEEFITLFEVAPRTPEERAQAAEAQERLLNLLVNFLIASHVPVKLLLAFREDYFTKLQKLFARCRDLMDQGLRLLPPSVDELPLTIRGPFQKNPGMFANPLPDEVCAQLETELRERSSGGLQNPTEGQIAGLVLWLAKDPHELLVRRKVQGLLEDYLVQQLEALPMAQRAPAVAILSCLVTDAGTRNIVSRSDLVERVTESESVTEDAVSGTVDALVQNTGLVRQEFRDRTAFYQIISEFLIPWIRTQKAERARIEAERALAHERIEAQERLKAQQREAEQKLALQGAEADRRRAQDLAQTLRRVRRSRAVLVTLLLLLLGLATFGWWQRQQAMQARSAAETERERFLADAKEAARTSEDAARTALEQNSRNALEAEKRLISARGALSRTHDTTQAIFDAMSKMTPPNAGSDWSMLLQRLGQVVQATEAEGKQVDSSVKLTQQAAANAVTVPGWSLYGRLQDEAWVERYFHNDASRLAVPEVGNVIVADTFVNVRKNPRTYELEQRRWIEPQIIGVIAPDQRLKVVETRSVTGPPGDTMIRFWVRSEPPAH
ncbi:MAG: nSTAND1 domain-containing NTPase [Chthoniobacterales bacterium]